MPKFVTLPCFSHLPSVLHYFVIIAPLLNKSCPTLQYLFQFVIPECLQSFVIKSTWNWFIVNLQVKTFCEMPLLVKNETMQNKPLETRRSWNVSETFPNKWNKEKPPSWWATSNVDIHSVFLDSINFYLSKALYHTCLEFLE